MRVVWSLVLGLWGLNCLAQESSVNYEWVQKRDRDGIVIYTSKFPGSPYKAVRGEMEVDSSVNQLVALVSDLPRCADWADLCETSESLQVISSAEQIVHIYNNIPFPVKDRDVVATMLWQMDSESGRVSMLSKALGEEQSFAFVAKNKRAVRITDAVTQWHFTPLTNGRVKVENYAHIDPNGPTPAWLTNLLLVDTPYKTMQAMRKIVEAGEYAQATLPF